MTTTSLAPRIVSASLDAATRAMYVANCRICTLAENMRVCPACKFNVGLIAKIIDREYDKPVEEKAMGLRRILHDCENDPEPEFTAQLDAVEAFTAALRGEMDKPTEQEAQAAEADSIRRWLETADTVTDLPPAQQAAIAYGDWNPAEHIPADPSVMSQSGWVCNAKRAAIKAAYEKQLHKDYNALFQPRCICTADLTDWPVLPNPDCPLHGPGMK